MEKVRLPSGSELTVSVAPFADSKALYQALLEEVKGVKLNDDQNIDGNFYKDLFCTGFSSKRIEAAVQACMKKCLIDGEKFTNDYFEPEEKRADYFVMSYEVTKANISPFTKDLYARFTGLISQIQGTQA